ncbi:hypothetical protein [Persicitalea sp.]|uniref:hypothetical protein n=1 Tax=Persicitalea sp. TaxID=3100273 RepID=UPI0035931A0C
MEDVEDALRILRATPPDSLDYVKAVAEVLVLEGLTVGFNPDTPFKDYVDGSSRRLYDDNEAQLRDIMMGMCFDICEKEQVCIYEVTGRITLRGTPWETMFDSDHEEQYNEFMQKVDLGIQEYAPSNTVDVSVKEMIQAQYN